MVENRGNGSFSNSEVILQKGDKKSMVSRKEESFWYDQLQKTQSKKQRLNT